MKKIPGWLILVFIVAGLALIKILFFKKENGAAPAGQQKKESPPVAVNYYVVKTGNLENNIFTTGKIGAFNEVSILPEVSGRVISVNFKEGETISKGALMVKLNDADLSAQLVKVQAQIKLAEQKVERLKQLIAVKGISQEEYDMQENELLTLKADENYIKAQIAKTNIVAPFTGVAGLRNVSEGSFVNALTPIANLVQMSPLYVEFSVPEKYNVIFHKGATVRFSVDNTDSSSAFEANIYAIEPKVDETTRTIRARALYKGGKTFYPGSFVKVYVDLGNTENAIMIPTQALIATLKGQKVFVSRAGLATEVQVKIGVRTDKNIQITEGLQEGDTVLTTGLLALKAQSKIKLINSKR